MRAVTQRTRSTRRSSCLYTRCVIHPLSPVRVPPVTVAAARTQGLTDVKEGHFHAQCPGVVLSAGAEGLHIFKPDLETRPEPSES